MLLKVDTKPVVGIQITRVAKVFTVSPQSKLLVETLESFGVLVNCWKGNSVGRHKIQILRICHVIYIQCQCFVTVANCAVFTTFILILVL